MNGGSRRGLNAVTIVFMIVALVMTINSLDILMRKEERLETERVRLIDRRQRLDDEHRQDSGQ